MLLSRDRVRNICKLGRGADCCKFLLAGQQGLECGKLDSVLGPMLAIKPGMVAKGDNCDGIDHRKAVSRIGPTLQSSQ